MPQIERTKEYTVANGALGTVELPVVSDVNFYRIKGAVASPTLADNLTFTYTGSLVKGMVFYILYDANIILDGHILTIFGKAIQRTYALQKLFIVAYWNGSAFITTTYVDFPVSQGIGGDELSDDIVDDSTIEIASNQLRVKDEGITLAKLQDFTEAYLLVGDALDRPQLVTISGDITMDKDGLVAIGNLKVSTAMIQDEAVTTGKMADLAQGSILVGNASGRPTALDAKTSAYLLLGDGTDLISVPVSGDITISAAGVVSIGSLKITTGMIQDEAVTMDKIEDLASGYIIVGNASNRPTKVAISGDATISNTGVITIEDDAITASKVPDGSLTPSKLVILTESSAVIDGIICSKKIAGADLKVLLDSTNNDLLSLKQGEVFLYADLFVQTIAGSAVTIDIGVDASIRSAGADPDGIIVNADGNVTGIYSSKDGTYMGVLQAFGFIEAEADGYLTIQSSVDVSGSVIVGSVVIYYLANRA